MHSRRFSEGIEQLPDTPEKRLTGRFSRGIERWPDTPEKAVTRRFSHGIEQLPDTPEKRALGRFSRGCRHDANAPQPTEHMTCAANPAAGLTTEDISMTTLTKTYPTELAPRRAVEALRATGVPERDIRLLPGSAPRDIRREPVGGFAGRVAPDAPIGTYGGRVLQRRQGAGSFAGDPDQQRQGSFADTDGVVIVTYKGDAERARTTGLRGARRLLTRAALDDDAVDRAVGELHQGHAILLVDLREIAASEADARHEKLARAA